MTPVLKRAWSARSELADATAVELTRNPDGVAKGLARLSARDGLVPGTESLAHLFVVGLEVGEQPLSRRQAMPVSVRARGAEQRRRHRLWDLAGPAIDQQRALEAQQRMSSRHPASPLVGFHPRLGHRLDRLAVMGASVTSTIPVHAQDRWPAWCSSSSLAHSLRSSSS